MHTIRSDGQRNLLAVAKLVALYAQWDTLESRPTWAKLIARSGLAQRTVARWLQELRVRGWLAHLEHGTTPATRPLALAWLEGNRAALYGLRIPLSPEEALHQAAEQLVVQLTDSLTGSTQAARNNSPTVAQPASDHTDDLVQSGEAGDKSGTLPWPSKDSFLKFASGFSRASKPVDNFPTNHPARPKTELTALRADLDQENGPNFSVMFPVGRYQMLAAADALRHQLPVFARCSRKLTRHLCKPYWRAGWTNRDITWALDHRPSVFHQPTGVLLCPEQIHSATQFITSRLRAWRTSDGNIRPGYPSALIAHTRTAADMRTEIAQRHGHAGARLLRAGEHTLTAERITEHGNAARISTTAQEDSNTNNPRQPAQQHHQRHTAWVAHARAQLTRADSSPSSPTGAHIAEPAQSDTHSTHTPLAAETVSSYDRALARARGLKPQHTATRASRQRRCW